MWVLINSSLTIHPFERSMSDGPLSWKKSAQRRYGPMTESSSLSGTHFCLKRASKWPK